MTEGLNEKGAMELIDLKIFFRRLGFFVVPLKAAVPLGRGRHKTRLRSYEVAGSVFDDVINGISGSSEAGKVGSLCCVDLGIVRKIQILQHIDYRENNPGTD